MFGLVPDSSRDCETLLSLKKSIFLINFVNTLFGIIQRSGNDVPSRIQLILYSNTKVNAKLISEIKLYLIHIYHVQLRGTR